MAILIINNKIDIKANTQIIVPNNSVRAPPTNAHRAVPAIEIDKYRTIRIKLGTATLAMFLASNFTVFIKPFIKKNLQD
jgi:hypothetical protein